MSLINDALKRAKEAQRPNTPSSVSTIRTIDARPNERPFANRLLVVVIFLLLSAAFAFIGLAMTGRLAKKNMVGQQIAAAQPVTAVAAPNQPISTAVPVVTAAVTPGPPKSVPALAPAAVVAAAAVLPPPPPLVLPDTLHVQGIAYDPVRPWAIVSGRTVYLGDLVKGVRVIGITKNTVTFGSNGQSNLLYVGQ